MAQRSIFAMFKKSNDRPEKPTEMQSESRSGDPTIDIEQESSLNGNDIWPGVVKPLYDVIRHIKKSPVEDGCAWSRRGTGANTTIYKSVCSIK